MDKDGKRLYGKEYNSNGELVFEGEYLNGKRWVYEDFNDKCCSQ